ncbi:MAG: glutamate racemase [Deltaproteobacteria bacterium]|nr:glutamate racemase [Deltaproteobacteria bacterium]
MIGILDSGTGGLTVARALGDLLPGMDMTYLGDTGRFPYGSRSSEKINAYVDQGVDFLVEKGAELIVFACVTSSAALLGRPGRSFAVPFVDAVTPTVDRLLALPTCRRIGVVGTEATVRSGVFDVLINKRDPAARIYARSAPLLVPLIEDGRLDRPETRMIAKKYLHPLKVRQVGALVMACNHYRLIRPLLQRKIGKRAKVVDCVSAVADSVKKYAEQHMRGGGGQAGAGGSRTYYLTDITGRIASIGKMMFGRNLTFQYCELQPRDKAQVRAAS